MKKKIIISSESLFKYIRDCRKNAVPDSENSIVINCSHECFYIANLSKKGIYYSSVVGQSVASGVELEIDYKRLTQLENILKNLSVQPIVLTLTEDHIHISDAVI